MRILCLLAIYAVVVFGAPKSADIRTEGKFDHIVSIPDIHGDSESLLRTLWMLCVHVNGDDQVGPFSDFREIFLDPSNTTSLPNLNKLQQLDTRVLLVQTGDIVDRGNATLTCYKIMWRIEKILKWETVFLLGNHEVMTLAGLADNYVHPEDIGEFGTLEKRRAAFSPGGRMWKKLTDTYVFLARVEIGSDERILFAHAGLDPGWLMYHQQNVLGGAQLTVDSLNEAMLKELRKNPGSDLLHASSSPIWTRTAASASDAVVCQRLLPNVFRLMNGTRLVVGHTPQASLTTTARCDEKLLLADVALSKWMGDGHEGNPSALVFALVDNGRVLESIHNIYWSRSENRMLYQEIAGGKNTNDRDEL